MKKIIAIFALLSIILSFAACNKNEQDDSEGLQPLDKFDIAETKDIVLGNEVDSVVLTTSTGEKITVDSTVDFFEIFGKVDFSTRKVGKKYSCVAETKLHNQSKSFANINCYYLDGAEFYESRAKKDGDDAVAASEEYSSSKKIEDNKYEMITHCRYFYKDEKAFGGTEYGESGYKVYVSDAYPMIPDTDTELGEMHPRLNYPRNLIYFTEFFKSYEPYESNNKTYDFNEFVTREYKLYENYIVCKQTSPFLIFNNNVWQDPAIAYNSFLNSDCSITQEAYCNVKTGEIELIKVYGDTLWHVPEYLGFELEINMQIYIHNFDETESQPKIDNLISYIKSNAD